MSLVASLHITDSRGFLSQIGGLVIRRLEPLENPAYPADEVHTYEASIELGEKVEFTHRYGDGAWACVQRGLEALGVTDA